ncbi:MULTISPECIES: pantoate--beta-alanine ligase [unclassified Arsukibacterium]|uniref:pantoate--beta-alanine ligase n=1 Tax=unclassified Arsukibacterium TaxID=2635278 RepID=UPI000C440C83|nr:MULTISPECIES: pantoate--beta-alanine ligase [unclassified Arsukibacterium]MAA95819.1 pantoate--beta-alanine ligase [Rheinheimera sp.]MBM33589.1 pantoate--beta-alanine ligase [Rheinheimera sp.]|tara:strand:- start:515 stop:1357 length:843 start_codon:yes stop_codon:yes gene_type:complete
MNILANINELRAQIASWRRAGKKIAFVPTMGNLHQGHLQLVDVAKRRADKVIVSIFVNPMQFGQNEDLANYPRTMADDIAGLTAHNADALFSPTPQLIYPRGLDAQTFVEVPLLGDLHCGANRPGHFRGVSTIVCKLFNLVQPDIACFGKKDFQQLAIIRQMVIDLSLPIEILGVATERAADGLALSSRNGYLTTEQRAKAPALYQILQQLKTAITNGNHDYRTLEQQAKVQLTAAGFVPDYVNISNQHSLALATTTGEPKVILAAARLGTTRLIDNLEL